MSFIKYGIFRLLNIVGKIVAVIGIMVFLLAMLGSNNPDAIPISITVPIAIAIFFVGLILNWIGGFRSKATLVERGTRDALRKGDEKNEQGKD